LATQVKNEKRDKIISNIEDVICINPIISAKMYYDSSLLQTNPHNCLDEKPLEMTSYKDGVILTAIDRPVYCSWQEYQSMAPCHSNRYVLIEQTCHAVVIVKDTQTSSSMVLSQVLGNNDKRNLGVEYEKYEKRILAYIISLGVNQSTAEDLTQNVFIQSCYDYANGREIKHMEGYLFGLARNIVHIYRRRESLLPTMPFLSDIDDTAATQSVTAPMVGEVNSAVYEAIAKLPQKYQEALSLRYIHNLPLSVAAQQAGCSKNAFYQRVHIATSILKSKLRSSR
jgi:RNA polymerase sigma factor (sigma-70 family)